MFAKVRANPAKKGLRNLAKKVKNKEKEVGIGQAVKPFKTFLKGRTIKLQVKEFYNVVGPITIAPLKGTET